MKHILILLIGLMFFACEASIVEKIKSKHPNGEKKIVEYYQNIDGKDVIIEEKQYHDNGEFKMGGKFKNELREGEWKAYFSTGKIQSEGSFKNGKSNGSIKVYYPNGQIIYEGKYKEGEKTGHWKFYNEQGKLTQEKDY